MKKKLMLITTIVMVVALAAAGTAFAANGEGNETSEPLRSEDGNGNGYGRSDDRETGQRFAVQAEMFETEEEFHEAVLAEKLAIIEAKVADGSLSEEDAATIREHLTSCDGTCELEGENPDKPEGGWGIFGQSGQGSQAENGGARGNSGNGNGENVKSQDCDEEGTPLEDGSGSENGQGYKGGRNN